MKANVLSLDACYYQSEVRAHYTKSIIHIRFAATKGFAKSWTMLRKNKNKNKKQKQKQTKQKKESWTMLRSYDGLLFYEGL